MAEKADCSSEDEFFVEALTQYESQLATMDNEADKAGGRSSEDELFVQALTQYESQIHVAVDNEAETGGRPKSSYVVQTVCDDEIKQLVSDATPINTRKQTKWAVEMWKKWAVGRDAPLDLLKLSMPDLVYWVKRFICEVRKQDGSFYPTESLMSLFTGLEQHIRTDGGRPSVNFFSQPEYAELKVILDAQMKSVKSRRMCCGKRSFLVIILPRPSLT